MTARKQHRPAPAILKGMAGILDQVTRLSCMLSGVALASILVLTLKEVAMRYFFNAPTTWANDVNQWFFALAVMLVMPEITRTNGHIAISVLVDRLSHGKKDVACRVIAILSCLLCMAAFYITGMETLRQYQFGITTMWVSPIPKWWISVVIPLGFLLSALQFFRLVVMPGSEREE
ncbi:TRAP transporter small permease [Geoalkalibacter halelectricus]|uniref:TRAP transporter small permease n=1 Tax=Geoalkalibacter halelectricus TaxID=2847045 RepID=A0ABY5ZJZ1_9BACT|nr:TRAP transporter small permease [Geoalkalibacter halelectricus]MDO3380289.1 TRAP transporter small permease [Geoalkalibacter halelectricus]UWZ79441.1 TRAP transporter small permease [Geoalkalibacter halelectricus]